MKWRILLELTETTGSVGEMVTGTGTILTPGCRLKPRPMDIVVIAGNVRIAARGAPSRTGARTN